MHLVCMNARLVYKREVCAQLKREARIKMIPNFIRLSRGKRAALHRQVYMTFFRFKIWYRTLRSEYGLSGVSPFNLRVILVPFSSTEGIHCPLC